MPRPAPRLSEHVLALELDAAGLARDVAELRAELARVLDELHVERLARAATSAELAELRLELAGSPLRVVSG